MLTARSPGDESSLFNCAPHPLEGRGGLLGWRPLWRRRDIHHVDLWEWRLVDLHLVLRVYQTPLLDDALYLLVQSLAVDCLVGVDCVVPLVVLAPLELIGLRDLMSGRKLQLLLLEE